MKTEMKGISEEGRQENDAENRGGGAGGMLTNGTLPPASRLSSARVNPNHS